MDNGDSIQIYDDLRDLAERISSRFDLDEVQALTFLQSFLQSEDRNLNTLLRAAHEPSSSKRKLLSGAIADDLLDAFNVFFFEEQIYILRCVSALLRIAEDSQSDLFELSQELLPQVASDKFGQACLERLRKLQQSELPPSVRTSPNHSSYWAKHSLRMQVSLLEVIFLLYYGQVNPSGDFIIALHELLQATELGQRQANEAFFDSEALQLLLCIQHLLTFVAVETLDLEKAMDGYAIADLESSSAGAQNISVIQSPHHLGQAIDLLEETTPNPGRSPLLLAWALIFQRLEDLLTQTTISSSQAIRDAITPSDGGDALWTRLAAGAFAPEMALLPTLRSMAKSPLLNPDSSSYQVGISAASSLAFRAVFKGLLLSVTEVVRPEYITPFESLIELWELTFDPSSLATVSEETSVGVQALCAQLWRTDMTHETRFGVLETAKRRWPVQLSPLLRLLRALTGACAAQSGEDLELKESQDEAFASLEVLRHFGELTTIAHVLPATSVAVRPPWEVIESADHLGLDYRATRSIPLFGPRLAIPAGTVGRMVSEPDSVPTVVVWQLEQPISGWKLIRDILADFVQLLRIVPTSSVDRDDVFAQNSQRLPGIGELAPSSGDHETIATDILHLFIAVLKGAPSHATTLLNHLETSGSLFGSHVEDSAVYLPSLVAITRKILDQSLSARAAPTTVVRAAYQLLGLLLKHRPSEVWLAVRSSNIIVGSSGQASWTSTSVNGSSRLSSSSSLLPFEISTGSFAGIKTLINFHASLWSELQRSQYSIAPDLLRIKTDVLLRGIQWLIESVWSEYQSWRYQASDDRVQIGLACTRLLDSILSHRSTASRAPTSELQSLVKKALITNTSTMYLNPITAIIATGHDIVESLHQRGHQTEATRYHQMICSTLQLCRTIVHCRQDLSTLGKYPRSQACLLENMLLGDANALTYSAPRNGRRDVRCRLLESVFRFLRQALSTELSLQATQLITSLAVNTEDDPQGQLSNHLSSGDEIRAAVTDFADILDNTYQEVQLRISLWNLAAAFVQTQPSLASVLLTGSSDASPAKASLAKRSTLQVASDSLAIWQSLWNNDPALLETVLHFLCCAWSARLDDPSPLEHLREQKQFWTFVTAIISAPVAFDEQPSLHGPASREEVTRMVSHQLMSKARALVLLATEFDASSKSRPKTKQSASTEGSLGLITSSEDFSALIESAVTVTGDAELQVEAEGRLHAAFPEIPLFSLRHAPRRHDFDIDREYGTDYIYNLALVRNKLEGFCDGDDGDEADLSTVVDDAVIEQAIKLLSDVSLEWSVIDSQTACLRAWRKTLEALFRRKGIVTMSQQQERDARQSCLQSWLAAAKVTAHDDRTGAMMSTILAERMALLKVLLEAAWGQIVHECANKATSQPTDISILRQIVEEAQRLLTHPTFGVIDSIRGNLHPAFHQDAFSMVLLCVRRCRQVLPSLQNKESKDSDPEAHRAIHTAIDSFTTSAVHALRQSLDQAATAAVTLGTGGSTSITKIEEDLTLLGSLLELLIRPDVNLEPHFWLTQCQSCGLLEAAVGLLRIAPHRPALGAPTPSSTTVQTAPFFMPALLSLLLALAARQQSAEQVVLAGLMTALTSNALSQHLEAGAITPGSGFHACWLTMLRIVISVVENLDVETTAAWAAASARFVEVEAMGFVRLYGPQIGRALDFSPFKSSGGPASPAKTRSLNVEESTQIDGSQLNELEAVMRLFLVMASADDQGHHGASNGHRSSQSSAYGRHAVSEMLATFARSTVSILQQIVYLTQRPHQSAALLHIAADDKAEEKHISQQLSTIAATAVAALWHQSQGSITLCSLSGSGEANLSSREVLIRPTMRTAPGETASIGTLIDFASFNSEALSSTSPTAEQGEQILVALEQGLALAITQLALSSQQQQQQKSAGSVKGGKSIVESGIQRDLTSAVNSGLSAAKAFVDRTKPAKGASSVAFLEYLASLCDETE